MLDALAIGIATLSAIAILTALEVSVRRAARVLVAAVYLSLPASVPAGGRDAGEVVRALFGSRGDVAECVARAESKLRPGAVGKAGERGIFQIHPVHWNHVIRRGRRAIYVNPRWLFIPRYNARVAYVMSRAGTDWSAWWTASRC